MVERRGNRVLEILGQSNMVGPGSEPHEITARYEFHFVNFIKALRKDFDAPNAKFVLATLDEATEGSSGNGGLILDAQLAR